MAVYQDTATIFFVCGWGYKGVVMAVLDYNTVQMYQNGRSNIFIEALQQETAVLKGYVTMESVGKVKMHRIPVSGTREMRFREQRHEKISGTEDMFGWRTMRPVMFQDWDPISTDDPLFLDNLPINLTRIAKNQAAAAARATDGLIMGTVLNTDSSSPLFNQYVVRTATSVHADAVENSMYKGGTTSGVFGTAFGGEFGDVRHELVQQPYIVNKGLTTKWDDVVESSVLDLRRSNVVHVSYGDSGSPVVCGMTPSKIKCAISMHRARKSKGRLVLCITHQQALDMMEDEEFKNVLYGHQVMKNGLPDSILGVKLLITDHVPLVDVGGGKFVRSCPMYAVDDLVFGMWEGAKFEIRQPEDEVDTIWAGVTMTMGCTRRREESFVCIHCDEGF